MRKDSTNIIPACLVDSVHDAIVPVIKCYDACNIFNMEIGLWLIVMIVPLLIRKFKLLKMIEIQMCVYRFSNIQHPAIAIHSFVRNQ